MLTLLEREMHTKEMSSVSGLVAKMSAVQRAILALALQGRRPKDEVLALVEARLEGANLRCPHCACVRLVRNGHASGLQRYKCRGCTRTCPRRSKSDPPCRSNIDPGMVTSRVTASCG